MKQESCEDWRTVGGHQAVEKGAQVKLHCAVRGEHENHIAKINGRTYQWGAGGFLDRLET